MSDVALPTLTAKDFTTDQDVRWCPGCGDYAVLAAVRKTLPQLGRKKEDFVFISGIGCAARFPYYMETFGLHSIHGRAPAFATGVKLANPELDVWLVSGDGDLLSIGGNHTVHIMRRNVDVNIILLNNQIYGLTKGQYSPTSERGKVTKSTPDGSIDSPLNPLSLALGAESTFIARGIDIDAKHLTALMQRGAAHRGTSFIEVYQDCNIFNHKVWFYASQKDTRPDHTVECVHGEPLVFGADRTRGIRFVDGALEVIELGGEFAEADCMVHDERNRLQAWMLTRMRHPEFPEPLGVLYCDPDAPSYGAVLEEQVQAVREQRAGQDLESLVRGRDTWDVE
ncbi:MAG: 2-oxoacid:ferredoxin oxidoreductase subunit beta [Planctomycetota bacterium]|nr:2-oxoacid:ferredoxin oxidoreductase subunit beta [Planctomycetota bacterium]